MWEAFAGDDLPPVIEEVAQGLFDGDARLQPVSCFRRLGSPSTTGLSFGRRRAGSVLISMAAFAWLTSASSRSPTRNASPLQTL